MEIYWQLFCAFFRIGGLTFGGGLAQLPMLKFELVQKYHWLEEPELLDMVMSGDLYLSQEETLELSHMAEKERREGIRKFLKQASRKARSRYIIEDRKSMRQTEEANPIPLSIGIKEMPAFNPDMELQGLTLTMPTWMMAMDRAVRRSDMTQVSGNAKAELRAALMKLDEQIKTTLEALS